MATNADIVTSTYQAIAAGNSPTAADLATYTALMNGGWTQAQVAAAIELSPFVQNVVNPVIREYQAAFGRVPDQAGLQFWVNQIAPSGPGGAYNTSLLGNLNTTFSSSAEFQTRYGSGVSSSTVITTGNSALVIALYNNVLGRNPDTAGLNYWTSAGVTVSQLLQAFAQSAEFVNLASASITAYENAEVAGNAPTSGSLLAIVPPVGVTANLTTGVDTISGTSFADSYTAVIGSTGIADTATTLNPLDTIDGGAGSDTLTINDQKGGTNWLANVTVKNVETINFNSAAAATVDTTVASVSGVTALNVNAGTSANVTVGSTTALSVSNVTGTVTAAGGATQTFTNNTGAISAKGSVGAVTVSEAAQGTTQIAVDDGTNIKVTTTSNDTGQIHIGDATAGGAAPTGTITVTDTLAPTAGVSKSTGTVTVQGGTVVNITENSGATLLTAAGTNSTVTFGTITVNGTSTTTSATVTQAASASEAHTVAAVTGATESASVQFGVLKAGDVLTVAGLTLTASADMTAKQVAAAFAKLSAGGSQLTGYTSGAVSGTGSDTVVFTSTKVGNVTDLAPALTNTSTNSVTPTVTITQGVDAVTAKAGATGVVNGAVTIANTASSAIATVSLTNFGNSTIASDVLTNLTLTNAGASAAGTVGITNAKATTLDLTLNGGTKGIGAVSLGATYTALKVHDAAATTLANLTGAGVTALTVDGTGTLTLTASTLAALKTVTLSGAAGLSDNATGTFAGGTVTDVNASATSGNVTVSIDATKATYEGGTGNDTVTIAASATKAISGGSGSDTLVINTDSGTFSNASANANISGFEILGLGAAATGSYDATGFTGLTEGAVTGAVTYTNVAAGTGLTITAAPTAATTYTLKDATGTSDSLALTIKGAIAANSITASGIESVSINSTDSGSFTAGSTSASATLVDTAATAITVTGNTTFTLTATGDTKLTSVDASGMTGGLTYTTAGTTAETVKGGAAANTLTATTGTTADTLIGGAASDTLTANAGLDTLTGNGGNNTFKVQVATANVNTYSTVTDAHAGDTLVLKHLGAETFTTTKVVLGGTAVFQDYANATVNAAGDAHTNAAVGWFQYNGDTYVVESLHNASTTTDFQNNTDIVVKLTGLIDLSAASFITTGSAPELLLR